MSVCSSESRVILIRFRRTNVISFDHVHLKCTQRECQANESTIDQKKRNVQVTNFRYSNWKVTSVGKTSWKDGHMILRHGRTSQKYVEMYCELTNKKTEQLYTVSTPCLDDHNWKKDNLEVVGEMPNMCSQFVFKCMSKTTRMRRTNSRRSISLLPGENGRCTITFWKIRSQNVQIFGYVYRNTNSPSYGPGWKIHSFLLSEICTVVLWQDDYGKGNLRTFYWNTVGRRFPNWECLFV